MIKKLLILAVIAAAVFFFYKKFLAETIDPFFTKKSGKVDVLQNKLPDYNALSQ